MVPAIIGALGAGAGILNNVLGGNAEDEYREQALRAIMGTPAAHAQTITPEQVVSQAGQVSIDPRGREAQLQALQQLTQDATTQGLTPQEQYTMHQIRQQTGQEARANRQAMQSQMAARGMGGSGIEALSRMTNQQSQANQAANMSMQANAQAQQRRQMALQGMSNQAGMLRGQDWNQAMEKAKAQDAVGIYNANNRMGAKQFNANQVTGAWDRNFGVNQAKADALTGRAQAQAGRTSAMGQNIAAATNVAQGIGHGIQTGDWGDYGTEKKKGP